MVDRLIRQMMAGVDAPVAIRRLRWLEKRLPEPATRLSVPYVFRGSRFFKTIKPTQTYREIEAIFQRVCEIRPKRVLEIGTAGGGTLYLWCQAAADDATIVSLDLPEGEFGGGYHWVRGRFYKAFARQGQRLELLRGDSHAAESLIRVKAIFGGGQIDFLFIDGDHTYQGVKADFVQYGPLVRGGGLIGFHDILPNPEDPRIEVSRLWNQLRVKLDTAEFVYPDTKGRRIGIGLVRVGGQPIDPVALRLED